MSASGLLLTAILVAVALVSWTWPLSFRVPTEYQELFRISLGFSIAGTAIGLFLGWPVLSWCIHSVAALWQPNKEFSKFLELAGHCHAPLLLYGILLLVFSLLFPETALSGEGLSVTNTSFWRAGMAAQYLCYTWVFGLLGLAVKRYYSLSLLQTVASLVVPISFLLGLRWLVSALFTVG